MTAWRFIPEGVFDNILLKNYTLFFGICQIFY